MAVGEYIGNNNSDGSSFGRTSASLVSLYGATPVVQADHITSVSTASATTTTPYGYAASTQADAIVTAVNAILVVLENLGATATS